MEGWRRNGVELLVSLGFKTYLDYTDVGERNGFGEPESGTLISAAVKSENKIFSALTLYKYGISAVFCLRITPFDSPSLQFSIEFNSPSPTILRKYNF